MVTEDKINKMNKKGFMRTIEVAIAIVLALIFVVYIIPNQLQSQEKKTFDFTDLLDDDSFRACTLSENYSCMTDIAKAKVPRTYNLVVNSSEFYKPNAKKDIFIDSLLVSGTFREQNPKLVRIYYWKK